MRIFSVLAILMLAVTSAFSQKTSKNNFGGSWQTSGALGPWSNGVVPAITNIGDAPNNSNWIIDGYVTSRTSGSPSTHTFAANHETNTFTVRDTLVFYGDVVFENKAMDFVIPTGGIVIIFGNMTFENKLDIGNGGILVVTGTVNFTGGSGQTNFTSQTGGKFFPMGGITGTHVDADATAQATASGPLANSGLTAIINFVNGNTSSLPVVLNSFAVSENNGWINLDWSTASQINFSHFQVEHSSNALQWNILTTIQGEGTTNDLRTYTYTHRFPQNGSNYYRLKMIDLDETFEYSEIKSIVLSVERDLAITPNPVVNNTLNFEINFQPGENDQLTIYDLTGIKLSSTKITSLKDKITLPASINKGTYIAKFVGQGFTKTVRLVVE